MRVQMLKLRVGSQVATDVNITEEMVEAGLEALNPYIATGLWDAPREVVVEVLIAALSRQAPSQLDESSDLDFAHNSE